jgi:hypothetical protein
MFYLYKFKESGHRPENEITFQGSGKLLSYLVVIIIIINSCSFLVKRVTGSLSSNSGNF